MTYSCHFPGHVERADSVHVGSHHRDSSVGLVRVAEGESPCEVNLQMKEKNDENKNSTHTVRLHTRLWPLA